MKRLENESFEDYKKRRTEENNKTKLLLEGKIVDELSKPGPGRATKRLNARINQKYQTKERLQKIERLKQQMFKELKLNHKLNKNERRSQYK